MFRGNRLLLAIGLLSALCYSGNVQARAIVEDHSKSFYGEKDGTASPTWKVQQIREQSRLPASRAKREMDTARTNTLEPTVRQPVTTGRVEMADLSPIGVTNLEPITTDISAIEQPVAQLVVRSATKKRSISAVAAEKQEQEMLRKSRAEEASKKLDASALSNPLLSKPAFGGSTYNNADIRTAGDFTSIKPTTVATEALYDTKKGREVGFRNNGKFNWPTRGTLLSSFGEKKSGLFNDGINIYAPLGREIKAAQEGTVVYIGNELKGYGNLVILRHKNRYMSGYAHLNRFAVKKGQRVQKGQIIGYVGKSGSVDRPQLHFTVRHNNVPVNPMALLAG